MLRPAPLDPHAVRRQFDRRAAQFDRADFLLREIERRMLDRLDYTRIAPSAILDLGCGRGAGSAELLGRFAEANVYAVDGSPQMARAAASRLDPAWRAPGASGGAVGDALRRSWRRLAGGGRARALALAAEAEALPLRDASIDLVWSNFALHWFTDPLAAVAEMRRILKPKGLLSFTMAGVDTLAQLRRGGGTLMSFPDMHDIGDALLHAGFAEPVMDMEKLVLTYEEPAAMLADLRALGGNALIDRSHGLHGRAFRDRMLSGIGALRAAPGEALELTVEVIYGHAWVPEASRVPEGYAPITVHRRR